MKTSKSARKSAINPKAKANDSSKLISLLALATGAVAMPQTSHADIIYTDLSANPAHVGFGAGTSSSYTFSGLPGTAQFGFQVHQQTVTTTTTMYGVSTNQRHGRTVTAGHVSGPVHAGAQGANAGYAVPLPKDAAWDSNLVLYYNVIVGFETTNKQVPGANYDHQYLGWVFEDTTQGNMLLYGWVEVGVTLGKYPSDMNVTIYGYAYDNTGAQITMGALPVPEPAPMGILALGALALGAKGVRAWRRNRPAASKS